MKTRTINIYSFDELSEKSKETAKYCIHSSGYFWEDDALKSLAAFANHFGAKLTNYEIDWNNSCRSSASFSGGYESEEQISSAIEGGGYGECKLTGYCFDDSALYGLREAWNKGEREIGELLQAGYEEWIKDCQSDFEYQQSDEATSEHCEANGYEFTEDGRLA